MDFFEHRQKYENKCKAKDFIEAVKNVGEFIKNPTTNALNIGTQIAVKQERDPIFKQEIESEPSYSNNNSAAQVKKLEVDKAKIVDELLLMKSENQKIYLSLQQKNREIEKVKRDCQNQTEDLLLKNDEALKEIKRLTHENKVLTAQNNQLKLAENVADSDNIYEVEKLMNHRIVNGKMSFLVRWKNYGPKHDSWVKQSDLHCDNILKTYLNLKNL